MTTTDNANATTACDAAEAYRHRVFDNRALPATPTRRPPPASIDAPKRPPRGGRPRPTICTTRSQCRLREALAAASAEDACARGAAIFVGAFVGCVIVGSGIGYVGRSCVPSPLRTLIGAGLLALAIIPVFVRERPFAASSVGALLLTALAHATECGRYMHTALTNSK